MYIDQANVTNREKYKAVSAIYETRDYNSFKFLSFNRDAKPRKDLLDALEKDGKFIEPIIVNKDMEVLDGQHRLLSAKLKRAPITFYIVTDQEAEKVIRSVNTERKNWSVREYIEFYAALGDRNFITLKEHIESDLETFLPDSTIIEVLGNRMTSHMKLIKKGEYKIGNLESSKEIFDFMRKVMKPHTGKLPVRVGRVIMRLQPEKRIDKERLLNVLRDVEVYEQVVGMETNRAIDYIMSMYNKGLTVNYIEYYFDSKNKFTIVNK